MTRQQLLPQTQTLQQTRHFCTRSLSPSRDWEMGMLRVQMAFLQNCWSVPSDQSLIHYISSSSVSAGRIVYFRLERWHHHYPVQGQRTEVRLRQLQTNHTTVCTCKMVQAYNSIIICATWLFHCISLKRFHFIVQSMFLLTQNRSAV